MRVRAVLIVAAAAAMLCLAAGCGGSGPPPAHRAGATHKPASAAAMRGRLSMFYARNSYTKTIVPVYPLALRLAAEFVSHPAGPVATAARFSAQLRRLDSRLAAVKSFPGPARAAFAGFRADSVAVLRDIVRATAHSAGPAVRADRRGAARDLYAFDQQIGVLAIKLGLVPGPRTH